MRATLSTLVGTFLTLLMCTFLQMINNSPNEVAEFPNMVYLLVHRPLFIIGFSMTVFPILVA